MRHLLRNNVPAPNTYSVFWSRVNIPSQHECWNWTGSMDQRECGRFTLNGLRVAANRFAWEFANKIALTPHTRVQSTCDNPRCCNPSHLLVKMPTENVPDAFLAWAAGLIDGEGCIMIAKSNRTHLMNYCVRLVVNMIHRPAIQRLQSEFGVGRVIKTKPDKNRRRQIWQWLCGGKDTAIVLRKVLPFLFIKHAEAELALKFLQWNPNTRQHPVEDYSGVVAQREEFYQKSRELKTFHWS